MFPGGRAACYRCIPAHAVPHGEDVDIHRTVHNWVNVWTTSPPEPEPPR